MSVPVAASGGSSEPFLSHGPTLSGDVEPASSPPESQHSSRRRESKAEQRARAERWRKYFGDREKRRNGQPWAETHSRKFRSDKRRPRRLRDERIEDHGSYLTKEVTTYPAGARREKRNIPKQPSGFWKTIWNHGIKIRKSEKTGNLCIYDKHDEYVDELEELDAFNLAIKLLDSVEGLRVKVHRNIRGNTWKEYIIRSYTQWKKDRGLAFAR
jgi:hypothetical protein